jgi:hypothetical protein
MNLHLIVTRIIHPEKIIDRLDLLARDFDLGLTERLFREGKYNLCGI